MDFVVEGEVVVKLVSDELPLLQRGKRAILNADREGLKNANVSR